MSKITPLIIYIDKEEWSDIKRDLEGVLSRHPGPQWVEVGLRDGKWIQKMRLSDPRLKVTVSPSLGKELTDLLGAAWAMEY